MLFGKTQILMMRVKSAIKTFLSILFHVNIFENLLQEDDNNFMVGVDLLEKH
jgi:hypothetical protein